MKLKRLEPLVFLVLAASCSGATEGKENGATSGNGATQANARTETGDEDAVVFAAAERFQVADCNFINGCFGEIDVQACIDMEYDVSDQCWVVDEAKLDECEIAVDDALQLAACDDVEYPTACVVAIRPCQCLPGYVQDNFGNDCHPECGADDSCPDDLQCRAGACREPVDSACEEGQKQAEVNGEVGCFDDCVDGECDVGFQCLSGICIAMSQ